MEFAIRHGGLTMNNLRRFSPAYKQRTNRCSECHLQGHNVNHCNSSLKALAEQYGIGSDEEDDDEEGSECTIA